MGSHFRLPGRSRDRMRLLGGHRGRPLDAATVEQREYCLACRLACRRTGAESHVIRRAGSPWGARPRGGPERLVLGLPRRRQGRHVPPNKSHGTDPRVPTRPHRPRRRPPSPIRNSRIHPPPSQRCRDPPPRGRAGPPLRPEQPHPCFPRRGRVGPVWVRPLRLPRIYVHIW